VVDPLFIFGSFSQGPPPNVFPMPLIGATGGLACVPYYSSLVVVDTSNPLYPHAVGSVLLPGTAADVVCSGTTAFVMSKESLSGGLLSIDLTTPSNPQVLGRVDLPSSGQLAVSGTKAFVVAYGHFPDDPGGNSSRRLVVIDISDPYNPSILGTVIVTGRFPEVSGTLVYISGNPSQFLGRVEVVDVSNPALPVVIGGLDIPDWEYVGRMAFFGNYGFVPVWKQNPGADHSGVAKLELVPSPQAPRLLGITFTPGGGLGAVGVSGTTLFAAVGFDPYGVGRGGIYVFDAATMGTIGASDILAQNVIISGGLVYAEQSQSSFVILPDHCYGAPTSVDPDTGIQGFGRLGAAIPNPSRAGATFIQFTVSRLGIVKLRIVDVSGREVRMLVNDPMEPGERRVEWDGRDSRGERVPAGIYLYELDAPGIKAARKLVRLNR